MEISIIPIIVILTYMFIEVLKVFFNTKDWFNKLLPIVSGIFGGVIGIIIYFTYPDMINVNNFWICMEIGIVSGLSATGTNQIIKKLFGSNKNGIDK